MRRPILTIAIPTYNRSLLLDRCLKSFYTQFDAILSEIEVIVSDNASSDNTESIVAKYNNIRPIIYIKNANNFGPDRNIAQCYNRATGKYIWIFGDDDFLLPGALSNILNLLISGEYCSIHLGSISVTSKEDVDKAVAQIEQFRYKSFSSAIEYFEKIHYYTTFITGNITIRNDIEENVMNKFLSTNLVQLSWIIPGIFLGKKNAIISSTVIAAQAENTGGYKLITTFSKNFNKALKILVERGIDKRIINIINSHLLKTFFPKFIPKQLFEKNNFEQEKGLYIMLHCYWDYPLFWRNIFPIYIKFYIKTILEKFLFKKNA